MSMKIFKGCADGIHRFEPRYNKEPVAGIKHVKGGGQDLINFLDAQRKITYVLDVCVRCGKIVTKDSQ